MEFTMAATQTEKSGVFLIIFAVAVIAFGGGYYYFQQKDKDTLFNFQVGDKQISAEVERE
jgi:hypothetical protein